MQIDKSHPIHIRNDNNKKRKKVGHDRYCWDMLIFGMLYMKAGCHACDAGMQARMPEAVEVVPRFGPAAKAARAKERELEKQNKISATAAAKL